MVLTLHEVLHPRRFQLDGLGGQISIKSSTFFIIQIDMIDVNVETGMPLHV